MQFRKNLYLLLCFFTLLGVYSCTEESSESEVQPIEQALEAIDPQESGEAVGQAVTSRSHYYKRYTFFTLSRALHCTGLTHEVFSGDKTLYAPSDEAFEALGLNAHNVCHKLDRETLKEILLYHVVGEKVDFKDLGCVEMANGDVAVQSSKDHKYFINDARLYLRWVQKRSHRYCLQVYAIDKVLTVPDKNIVATAQAASDFSILVAAVTAANPSIAQALSNEEAILTVFAPTNQAFQDLLAALGASSLDDVIAAVGVEGLSNILLYHVVDGCAASGDLMQGQQIPTLQGTTIEVDLENLQLKDGSGGASGLVTEGLDIVTSNGLIHTIDRVLLPN